MKPSIFRIIAATAALGTFLGGTAMAKDHEVSLKSIAHEYGFSYTYVGPDDVVSLTRSGVNISIRPGESFFEVNDRTEPIDGESLPEYRDGDVYVTDSIVKQLAPLGRKADSASAAASMGNVAAPVVSAAPAAAAVPSNVRDLKISGVKGADAVLVTGSAAPFDDVRIDMATEMSKVLPRVVISRSIVPTDAAGHFEVVLSTAPNNFTGSRFIVDATGSDDQKAVEVMFVKHWPADPSIAPTEADLDPIK